MSRNNVEDQQFDGLEFDRKQFPQGDYEGCHFVNCNFGGADLSHYRFTECIFKASNLSNILAEQTSFNDVKFIECKMLGVHFDQCSEFLFSVFFQQCTLTLSSFYKRTLKKTTFHTTILHDVDFTDADLSASVFDDCDLLNAKFENTVLEKTDFRRAFNYVLDPSMNRIKKAKFSREGLAGLLARYDIIIE